MPLPAKETIGCALIVEDNSFMKTFYEKALKDLPLRFLYSGDGEDAVKQALASKPVLILMDINLPKMDGVRATQKIRSSPGMEKLTVIAVSARSQDAYTASANFTDWVPKPVHVNALRDAIKRHLNI